MKKFSYVLMAIGVIIIIIGFLTFTNLKTVNAVDSHNWTIYINGVKSSPGRYLAARLLPYWELFLTWQPGSNQKAGTFNNFATAIGQYKQGIHTWQKVKTFVI
jgi:hypothetical protein